MKPLPNIQVTTTILFATKKTKIQREQENENKMDKIEHLVHNALVPKPAKRRKRNLNKNKLTKSNWMKLNPAAAERHFSVSKWHNLRQASAGHRTLR